MVHAGKRIALFCLGLVVSLPGPLSAQTAPPAGNADLQKVITRTECSRSEVVSAQADFAWDQFTAVVQEHETQTGTIYFERKKGVTRMAAYLKQDNGKDAPKTVVYDGGEVNFYEPTIKQLTTMKAGANRGQFESFLTLGFGGSGTDLEENWKVSLLGTEQHGWGLGSEAGPGAEGTEGAGHVHARDHLGRTQPGRQSQADFLPAYRRSAHGYLQEHPLQHTAVSRMSSRSSRHPAPTTW